jgi:hypothetical protein
LTERSGDLDIRQAAPAPRSGKEQIVGLYQVKYPLSVYTSLRAISSLRFDRNYRKSQEQVSFESAIDREKRIGLRLEYVFDNTLDFDINILHGSRLKAYIEGYNQFELDFVDGFDFSASKGLTSVAGVDARHYIPLLKYGVIALRGAAAFSFGNRPNLYYLGGVNNQLFNSFDDGIPTGNRNFAFQANANHMRGFKSNIRNGTNFAIVNTEVRIPIFKYILGKNQGLSFIRNIQVVGFADAGLAWYGLSPYSTENPINKERVKTSQIELDINYYRDPLIASYGFGVRTSLFGYFLRADYAYGVDTRVIQSPRLHLALGFDF